MISPRERTGGASATLTFANSQRFPTRADARRPGLPGREELVKTCHWRRSPLRPANMLRNAEWNSPRRQSIGVVSLPRVLSAPAGGFADTPLAFRSRGAGTESAMKATTAIAHVATGLCISCGFGLTAVPIATPRTTRRKLPLRENVEGRVLITRP